MQIDAADSSAKAIRLALQAVLGAYNTEKPGQLPERHAPAVLLRGAEDSIIGGARGSVSFGRMSFERAVMAIAHRGRGMGRAMLAALEHAALQRGARRSTCGHQVRPLLEKLGHGAIPDYRPGDTDSFLMAKRFNR